MNILKEQMRNINSSIIFDISFILFISKEHIETYKHVLWITCQKNIDGEVGS